MLNSRYVLLALFLSLALGFASSAYSECPPCYNDLVPMAGHGPAPDGSGRRVINVAIDNSWDVTPGHTDPAIWNAIFGCPACNPPLIGAIDKWNQKTGGSYFFKPVNGTGESPDIIFRKQTPLSSTACSDVSLGSFPYYVNLDAGANTRPQAALSATGAHEIGHTIGDADTRACSSIMNPAASVDWTQMLTYDVQGSDVQSSNQNINASTRTNCSSSISGAHPNSSYGYESYSPQGGGTCSTVLLTTDYYYCNELGCAYLGSSTQWFGSYCR